MTTHPIRILHLIEPPTTDWCCGSSVEFLGREVNPMLEHVVIRLGSDATDSFLGARKTLHARLAAPLGRGELAWPGLRRVLRSAGPFDLIHAWSLSGACATMFARWRGPLVCTLSPGALTGGRPVSRLSRLALRRADRLLCGSVWERDQWMIRRVPMDTLTIVARPPVCSALAPTGRAQLRRQWGVDESTLVLTSLADAANLVDAHRLVHLCGVLTVAGFPAIALVPRQSPAIERARRLSVRHRPIWPLVVEDRPWHEVLPAADLGIWRCGAHGQIPGCQLLESACGLGLPTIVERHAATQIACSDRSNTLMTEPGDPSATVRALVREIGALVERWHTTEPDRASESEAITQWAQRMACEYARVTQRIVPSIRPAPGQSGAAA